MEVEQRLEKEVLTALYLALYSFLYFSSPAVLWVADVLWIDGFFFLQ